MRYYISIDRITWLLVNAEQLEYYKNLNSDKLYVILEEDFKKGQ